MDACAKGLPLKRVASRVAGVLHAILRTSSGFWRGLFLFAGMLGCGFLISRGVHCVSTGKMSSARETETVIAVRFTGRLRCGGISARRRVGKSSSDTASTHDWQGKNDDPQRETEVRLLWTRDVSLFEISGALSQHHGFRRRRTRWTAGPTLGTRRRGSLSSAIRVECTDATKSLK